MPPVPTWTRALASPQRLRFGLVEVARSLSFQGVVFGEARWMPVTRRLPTIHDPMGHAAPGLGPAINQNGGEWTPCEVGLV